MSRSEKIAFGHLPSCCAPFLFDSSRRSSLVFFSVSPFSPVAVLLVILVAVGAIWDAWIAVELRRWRAHACGERSLVVVHRGQNSARSFSAIGPMFPAYCSFGRLWRLGSVDVKCCSRDALVHGFSRGVRGFRRIRRICGCGSGDSASEAQNLQAEPSSNGSCRSHRAPRSSTLVSHQVSHCGIAQAQSATRGPLRLRGRLLLMAVIRHDLSIDEHTTTAEGPSRSPERMLVLYLFSSVADRSDRGSAVPSQGLPSSAGCCSAWSGFLGTPSGRGSPPSRAAHPFDGDTFLCFGRCGDSTTATLRPRLRILRSRRGYSG